MNCPDFIGQILDGKYRMTRELGRGGMGTVYLATHLGTERHVAVKIIAPQFMQRVEFVERFRREARAAGRLRHPNVVDVTDFGFADSKDGQVAYLVMEYLDGCTLGEILDEERNLPIAWTLDILEQVCSAVQEAHEQGIIHRDLKPDNIWLEPNLRGGYTVKVLDFGIAKLEEQNGVTSNGGRISDYESTLTTISADAGATIADAERDATQADLAPDTRVPEGATMLQTPEPAIVSSESMTIQIAAISDTNDRGDGDISGDYQNTIRTRLLSDDVSVENLNDDRLTPSRSLYESRNSADLTHVGAVLGTPLYMSPEQCRGEHLDPRSDIYSLGVIAYQMLSGSTPFEGDFKDVMEAHMSIEPEPLIAKHVRRKMKRAIQAALSKDPAKRPQTAEAFASVLRSRSEGIFGLLRRALVIYSEHLPKFLMLTGFFSLPIIALTLLMVAFSFLRVSDVLGDTAANIVIGCIGFLLSVASAFCTNLIVGTNSWIVTQYLAVPLRPVRLRPALKEARKKWKRIAGSGLLTAILPFVVSFVAAIAGFLTFFSLAMLLYPVTESVAAAAIAGGAGGGIAGMLAFLTAYLVWILVPAVVMLENVGVREALARSRKLTKRSFWTSAGAVAIIFLIPAIVAGTISYVVNISGKAFDPTPAAIESVVKESGSDTDAETPSAESTEEKKPGVNFSFGRPPKVQIGKTSSEMDMGTRVKTAVLESLIQLLWLPMQILVFSFSAIIVALLYLKTRLAGGESMNDLIERFEDDERPIKKWQERVRQRLIQSGRMPSKP